jgi:hypothetical protein
VLNSRSSCMSALLLFLVGCATDPQVGDAEFTKTLQGQIVFAHRDGDFRNLYKINANGTDKVKLFTNADSVNSNSVQPRWSDDGSRIRFGAMSSGKWRTWFINADGSNPHPTPEEPDLLDRLSRVPDLEVKSGSILVRESQVVIYKHKRYNPHFNLGASEVAWGPQKQFVIFCSSGNIYIAKSDGSAIARIAEGVSPDWWYGTQTTNH